MSPDLCPAVDRLLYVLATEARGRYRPTPVQSSADRLGLHPRDVQVLVTSLTSYNPPLPTPHKHGQPRRAAAFPWGPVGVWLSPYWTDPPHAPWCTSEPCPEQPVDPPRGCHSHQPEEIPMCRKPSKTTIDETNEGGSVASSAPKPDHLFWQDGSESVGGGSAERPGKMSRRKVASSLPRKWMSPGRQRHKQGSLAADSLSRFAKCGRTVGRPAGKPSLGSDS
jgi:hypothetical protein